MFELVLARDVERTEAELATITAHRDQARADVEAYEAALSRTSTDHAPWFAIPADRKWYRNLAITQILVETLEGLGMQYPPPEDGLEDIVVT